MKQKRFDRQFYVPEERQTFVSINPATGEIKECGDLVTLMQHASFDLANPGDEIKLQVAER